VDDEWYPVVVVGLSRFEAIHGKTTWQAGHTTKYRFERFGQVMGDEVFVDLDGSHPGLPLVRDSSFSADAHDIVVVMHAIDELLH
jgi:hypothetical protein